jgi:hypothetical protein
VAEVELAWTADKGPWPVRHWQRSPGQVYAGAAAGDIPANATACFLNLIDDRGLTVSSDMLGCDK